MRGGYGDEGPVPLHDPLPVDEPLPSSPPLPLGEPLPPGPPLPLGEPFLHTRLTLPERPRSYLRRERIARHLDQGLGTPLTIVNGPAGAGKTLAVADWADRLDRPVAWLTAEDGDRRPGVFWAYLLEALRGCGITVGTDAVPGGRALLARLAEELRRLGGGVVVVVDEFERVTGADVGAQLEFVLRHAGDGLRLVLVGRNEPLLPLHRYRVAGLLTEVRGAELAFTDDEAALLLAAHGLRLPDATTHAVVGRTRGWAAGLRLCAMAALEADDPEVYLKEFEADRGAVADFLLGEVLRRQPADAQDLLLRVSVLGRFCPALADALTGRSDAEPLLVGLHRENAFVERLGHAWFRLHPLFQEILRAHLRVRLPGLEPELHRRAAHWLLDSGELYEALGHAAAAGDWDFAAGAVVDDLALGPYFCGLHREDYRRIFAGMGEARSEGSPVSLLRAARAFGSGDTGLGFSLLDRVEQGRPTGRERVCSAFLRGIGARLTGDPDLGAQALRDFTDAGADVPAALLRRRPELRALLLARVGGAQVWGGRFEEARALLAEVEADPGEPRAEARELLALIDHLYGWPERAERKAQDAGGTGLAALVLAAVAVERGDLDRAQALLDEHRGGGPGLEEAVRGLVLAQLALARGHPRTAVTTGGEPWGRGVLPSPWIAGARAALALAAAPAERRAGAAGTLADAVQPAPLLAVGAAWLLLDAGRAGDATALLGRVRGDPRAGPAVTVRAALVRARLAELAGDTAAVRRLVGRALLDGRRERLRRPFLDAGEWLGPLLAAERLEAGAAGWLPFGKGGGTDDDGEGGGAEPAVVGELSEREREVLRRLAGMMSTGEIAADLCVSVNTVKTQLKGVYRKLGVNRRNDAVRRGRELGLL
ncbi:LuxR C-terminal-related transcriptional regulator [Streptomyces sp. NPDC048290]|uniref:LuxR C-terminal-related transcriptional regulator n=1 Tax=Streptomyces sp. NPDC048290 TaxID=3155811 RepID=UPI003417CA9D